MNIINKQTLSNKLSGFLLRVNNRLENNGTYLWDLNGEKVFLYDLAKDWNDKDVCCFDIGANIGDYAGYLFQAVGDKRNFKLHLFEPQLKCVELLNNAFGKDERVKINSVGLSSKNNLATIYKNEDGSALASLYERDVKYYNYALDKKEEIVLRRADEYIEENGISKIDFVKIDVEGHELEVLEGFGKYLNSDFIDYIQFEYGGANLDSRTNLNDFYNLFTAKGFVICKIMKNHLEVRSYDPRYENFILQNFVAVSKKLL